VGYDEVRCYVLQSACFLELCDFIKSVHRYWNSITIAAEKIGDDDPWREVYAFVNAFLMHDTIFLQLMICLLMNFLMS
jgi:hypothetical protein